MSSFLIYQMRVLQHGITFFSIIIFQNYIIASGSEISKKELTVSLDKDFEKKNIFGDEIKNLTSKVEALEYEINLLKQRGEVTTEIRDNKKKDSIEKSIFELTDNEKSLSESKQKIKEIDGVEGRKLYELALVALKEKKYAEAGKQFNDFIEKNPNSALLSNAYYWYGESYFKRNDYDNAAINYLKGYKKYSKGEKAADSLLKLAYSLEKLEKKEEAYKILIKLKEEFPKRSASLIKATEDAIERIGIKK